MHLKGRRLFVVAGGTRRTASTRHRLWYYRPLLEANGVDLRWVEYDGGKSGFGLTGMGRRLRFLIRLASQAADADTVLIQKVLPPTTLVRRWVKQGRRVVYDYDDALFARFPEEPAGRAKRRKTRLDAVLASASAVIAGSPPLADYARKYASEVHVLYPSLQRDRYLGLTPDRKTGGPVVIGWIGNDQSQVYLRSLDHILAEVFAAQPGARLLVCSSVRPRMSSDVDARMDFLPWSESAEIEAVRRFDLAISPMATDPWSQARGGRVSVLHSMAAGVPVIASPGGGLESLMTDRVSGRLVHSDADWRAALHELTTSPTDRMRLGRGAREVIDRRIWTDSQYGAFSEAVFGPHGPV